MAIQVRILLPVDGGAPPLPAVSLAPGPEGDSIGSRGIWEHSVGELLACPNTFLN